MTNDASRGLVERAKDWVAKADSHDARPLEGSSSIVRDLAKATPLPTDAEHEARIRYWVDEALAIPSRSPGNADGYWLERHEIDRAEDLMRARPLPASEPAPEPLRPPSLPRDVVDKARRFFENPDEISAKGLAIDLASDVLAISDGTFGHWGSPVSPPASEPAPEPRPSSALLAAAKDVRQRWRVSQRLDRDYDDDAMHSLSIAIEAEEARGASEVAERPVSSAISVVEALLAENLDAAGCGISCKQSELVDWVRSLRKERDEACHELLVRRQEHGDATNLYEAIQRIADTGAPGANLMMHLGETPYRIAIAFRQAEMDAIDKLMVELAGRKPEPKQGDNPPSDVASVDSGLYRQRPTETFTGDLPDYSDPLQNYQRWFGVYGATTLEKAINELVRRALGGK